MCRRSPDRHLGSRASAYESLVDDAARRCTAATGPRRFGEVRGQDHVVTRAAERRARGPGRPRLPVQRPPRHGQDLHRPHPRQGAQLRATPSTASPAARATSCVASRERRASSTGSRSSTPRRTTGSTTCATCSSASRSARSGKRKVNILDEVHMLTGEAAERAAEDARGAARRTSCSCSPPPTRRRSCRRSRAARSTSSSGCCPPTCWPTTCAG